VRTRDFDDHRHDATQSFDAEAIALPATGGYLKAVGDTLNRVAY
jgi:hypothetical protein